MNNGAGWKRQAAAVASSLLMFAGAGVALPHRAQADNYGVSAACGRNYEPNVIRIDGDVNTPGALTVPQLEALPGQETLNISYLNHLGVAETFSETGPTLWTVLSVAAGGIKVPAPTPNEYVGEPAAQTTLYVVVIGTDGYETVVSEGEIDPGFGNAPFFSAGPKTASRSPRCRTIPPTTKARPSSSCRRIPMGGATPTRSAGSRWPTGRYSSPAPAICR